MRPFAHERGHEQRPNEAHPSRIARQARRARRHCVRSHRVGPRAGRPGVPLTLRAFVLDVSTCRPIKGAAVDIWHCDALGVYSGVAAQNTVGKRFLRGIQRTNANGLAIFKTIYPGSYPGRTVHMHVRVYLGGNVIHTGQLYFPEKVTDAVYKRSPYRRRTNRDTRNATDFVYRNGGRRSLLSMRRSGAGYIGEITMGVSR